MPHSLLLRRLIHLIRVAEVSGRHRIPVAEASETAAASRLSRRQFLATSAAGLACPALSAAPGPSIDVGIVGAGLAGLTCADQLKKKGVAATLYDAATRTGGRCWSLPSFFPGQVAERGGEFIDNLHKTMVGYAREFGFALEDVEKQPGEVRYFFDGRVYPEAVVVEEYRAFVDAMQDDLRSLSGQITADNHTPHDVLLDNTNLREYLETRGAGSLIKAAVIAAYIAEYGLSPDEQSCLNFLLFIHADRRSKFRPFGVFSDERYHVISGNEGIVRGLTARLEAQIRLGLRLVKIGKTSSGRIELIFKQDNRTVSAAHDAVVVAIPFSVLRGVELDPNLGLPPSKLLAIQQLGYGTNAKMMIGFSSRPWFTLHGSNGTSYSDLPNHQTTWETNPSAATAARAILTDYSGAQRGATLNPSKPQVEAAQFLGDLDRVYPGALAAATRDARGNFTVHLEHWPSNPLTLGSYTCYLPGQFTTIADNEGKPVGNLFFAGEHTNSFYEWQGFMEGACLSGIAAASAILG